jgi:hypothetical protein
MVGAVRFELTTSCTRNKRATRLRYAPTREEEVADDPGNLQLIFAGHFSRWTTPSSVTWLNGYKDYSRLFGKWIVPQDFRWNVYPQ